MIFEKNLQIIVSSIDDDIENFFSFYYQGLIDKPIDESKRLIIQCEFNEIVDDLPIGPSECVSLISNCDIGDVAKYILYAAALRKIRFSTTWIHYSIVMQLMRLKSSGVVNNIILLHCLVMLVSNEPDSSADTLIRGVTGNMLAKLFPRDAIVNSNQSIRLGNKNAWVDVKDAIQILGFNYRGHNVSYRLISEALNYVNIKTSSIDVCNLNSLDKHMVIESGVRELPPPKGDLNHKIFAEGNVRHAPSISIVEVPNGIYSLDISTGGKTEFYVFNERGGLVDELSFGVTPFIEDDIIELDFPLAIIDDIFTGAMNICHFLFDQVTRVYLFEKYIKSKYTYLVSLDHLYFRQVFQKLDDINIFIMSGKTRFSVRSPCLAISTNSLLSFNHSFHKGHHELVNFVRSKLIPDGSMLDEKRKIFISRRDAAVRNISNEGEIIDLLTSLGYEIVTLSGLTFDDQVKIFCNASRVIGLHGAGMTNTIFCPENAKVLEIFPPYYGTAAYWIALSPVNIHYHSFIADDRIPDLVVKNSNSETFSDGTRGCHVSPVKLKEFLIQNNF